MSAPDNIDQNWIAVTRAMDPADAEGRAVQLRVLGIPARVEPEAAGNARVTVPAWLESEARYAIAHAEVEGVEEPAFSRSPIREPERDVFSRISRAMLVVAAVAFSPFAVALTIIFALANRLRSK